MKTEPVAVAGGAASIVGLIMAGLLMAGSLGWVRLTQEQLDAIRNFLIPFVAVVGPVLVAAWARGKVTPTAKLTPGATVQDAAGQPAVLLSAAEARQLGIGPDGAL